MKKVFLFLFMLFTVSISYAVVQTSCKEKKKLVVDSLVVFSPVMERAITVEPIAFSWYSQPEQVIAKFVYKEKLNKTNCKVTKQERQNLARNVTA